MVQCVFSKKKVYRYEIKTNVSVRSKLKMLIYNAAED